MCVFSNSNFDFETAKQATQLFRGRHDFRTFMGSSGQSKELDHPTYTWRTIDEFTLTPSHSNCIEDSATISSNLYDYYVFKVTGRSFLNKQVRRMVSVILAAALGKITIKDVYEMLTIPSRFSWCPQASVIEPHGLYLCGVGYDTNELQSAIDEKLKDLKIYKSKQ